MSLHRVVPVLAIVLALGARDAQAFFDPPWIAPAAPRAGESVSVNIRGGICDGIFSRPGYPQITRNGNAIRLLEYGHHWETTDLCIYDIGTLVEPIGVFEPGEYTLTVDFTYDNYPFGYETITLGVVPFTVVAATPAASVSVLSPLWKFVLLVLLSCAALIALRRRRRVRC
jgi:hypothetical protein